MGKTSFDLEDLMDHIVATLKAGMAAKLLELDSEKNDGITLACPPADAEGYHFQDLNGRQVNADPFVLVTFNGLAGNPEESWPSATKTRAQVCVAIAWSDQGEDLSGSRRTLRYLRALTELVEEAFDSAPQAGKLVIEDQNVIPVQLLNSVQNHRATGVLIRADLG